MPRARRDPPIRLMRFAGGAKRDAGVEAWLHAREGRLGALASYWFDVMRACGEDVRELLHDGQPTACVGDAAFCYVDLFTHHVDVGFYPGAQLTDPNALLEGTGRFMRHVKLRPGRAIDEAALRRLVRDAYAITRLHLGRSDDG